MGLGTSGVKPLGYANPGATPIASGVGKSTFIATDLSGRVLVDPGTSSTSLGKAEDSAHTSGDSGVMCFGVRNTAASALVNTDGDYTPFALSQFGVLYTSIDAALLGSLNNTILKQEDAADATGYAGVMPLSVYRAIAASSSSADGDYVTFNSDLDGRLYVNAFGAAPGQTWQACSSAATDTSNVEIKAAVASNRIYVTSISCDNTAAVASSIVFKDGTTQIYRGAVSSSTLAGVASFQTQLPVPLRGTVNTAFNFAMATTATSTTCCAAGFISPN